MKYGIIECVSHCIVFNLFTISTMSQHRLNWCCESAPAWEHLEMPQKELDSVWEDGLSGFPF